MIANRLEELGMIKFAPREKTQEEIEREIRILKSQAIFACVEKLMLSEEYFDKISWEDGAQIKISIKEGNTVLIEDPNLMEPIVYEKVIEFNGKKEEYKIILKPSLS